MSRSASAAGRAAGRAAGAWLLVLLAQPCFASSATRHAASLQVLQRCAELTTAGDCPGLAQALSELGLADQIDIRTGKLDRDALEDLMRLAGRYGAAAPSAAPNVALLPLALERLRAPPTPPQSWWHALEERIEEWLGQPSASGSNWLAQLLRQLAIAQWVTQLFLYVITAAVIVMAVWVIVRELRASGVLGRRLGRRAAPAASSVPAAPSPAHGPGNLAELEQAPLAERSMLLLRLLVQALLRSGRLSHERTLTYRELEAHGAFDDTRQRRRFAHLAQLAERERYGARPLQSDEWPAIAREGGALYAQLLLPRRPAQAGAAPRAGAALEPRGCP